MDLSLGTLIGQILAFVLIVTLAVIAVRFLLAATRRINREREVREREGDSSIGDSCGRR